jgi:hypothetical protein
MEDYPNIVTRANEVDKLRDVMRSRSQGIPTAVEYLWHQLSTAYTEVNGSNGENFEEIPKQLSDQLTAEPPQC